MVTTNKKVNNMVNMKKMKIKPAREGDKIPNPKTGRFLKSEGEEVSMDKYWRRLLKSEQVVEAKKEMPIKKKTKPKKENIEENDKGEK
jgi:hypothetical protein